MFFMRFCDYPKTILKHEIFWKDAYKELKIFLAESKKSGKDPQSQPKKP